MAGQQFSQFAISGSGRQQASPLPSTNCFSIQAFIPHPSSLSWLLPLTLDLYPSIMNVAFPCKNSLRERDGRVDCHHVADVQASLLQIRLNLAENVHILTWHFVHVLFVFMDIVALIVKNNILSLDQGHGWDILLVFRGSHRSP